MENTFHSKLLQKILESKMNKKNINNSTYEFKLPLMAKEIYKSEDKQFIKNLFSNTNAKEKIKIFDLFEDKNVLYIISDKEYISQIEKLMKEKSNLEKEGIFIQNSHPISKKEFDELYRYEKSMCKIKFENIQNGKTLIGKGSGFFCSINYPDIPFTKAFFTANHVLNKNYLENEKTIIIEHLNKIKTIEITPKRRYFTDEKLDYTCVEILDSDKFESDNFFTIDSNILKNKKENLNNQEIFILQYPMGEDLSFSSGRILNINKNQIYHSASTCNGSSGSPIIKRFNNNIVGLHFGSQRNDDNNYAYYNFGSPFDSILKNIKFLLYNNNVITATFKINNDNSEVKIINSYENSVREGLKLDNNVTIEKNEEQIKKCIIIINEKKLEKFEYVKCFYRKGEYTIKYIFPTPLNSTNYMFYKCRNIIKIDLSSFNSKYVTNMCGMFEKCDNLKDINLKNINTSNVKNMSWMFNECESLTNLNLSHFQTQNVENMICMFNRCKNLIKLDLSNLDAQNVINMICMFWGCNSLTKINFTKFKTKNIVNMEKMFCGCVSLEDLNLSDFKTEKLETTSNMFEECKSLKTLNLSSFRTPKVKYMREMFFRCQSLISLDLSNFTFESIVSMDGMFTDMHALTSLDLSNFKAENVSLNWLFGGTKNLKKNNIKTNSKTIKDQL